MKIFQAALVLAACSVCAGQLAQPSAKTAPPTREETCWNTFKRLLHDCDHDFQEPLGRQACYTGANNYYSNCINPQPPTSPRHTSNPSSGNAEQLNTFDVGKPKAADSAAAYVMEGGDLVQVHLTVLANTEAEATVEVALGSRVGSGTLVLQYFANGRPIAAEAVALTIYDFCDLTQDGITDDLDIEAAIDRFRTGGDRDLFERFFAEWNHR